MKLCRRFYKVRIRKKFHLKSEHTHTCKCHYINFIVAHHFDEVKKRGEREDKTSCAQPGGRKISHFPGDEFFQFLADKYINSFN